CDFIYDNNKNIIGRGFISSHYNYPGFVIINSGIKSGVNFDSDNQNGGTIHGIFEGFPLNAARSKSQLLMTQEDLDNWVTSQLKKISLLDLPFKDKFNYALSGISLGGFPHNLPFALTLINNKEKYANYNELVEKFKTQEY